MVWYIYRVQCLQNCVVQQKWSTLTIKLHWKYVVDSQKTHSIEQREMTASNRTFMLVHIIKHIQKWDNGLNYVCQQILIQRKIKTIHMISSIKCLTLNTFLTITYFYHYFQANTQIWRFLGVALLLPNYKLLQSRLFRKRVTKTM